jgi:nickel-dependent lactate racemase
VEDEEREGVSANAGGEFATHREGVEVVDGGVVHVVECSCWTIAAFRVGGIELRI